MNVSSALQVCCGCRLTQRSDPSETSSASSGQWRHCLASCRFRCVRLFWWRGVAAAAAWGWGWVGGWGGRGGGPSFPPKDLQLRTVDPATKLLPIIRPKQKSYTQQRANFSALAFVRPAIKYTVYDGNYVDAGHCNMPPVRLHQCQCNPCKARGISMDPFCLTVQLSAYARARPRQRERLEDSHCGAFALLWLQRSRSKMNLLAFLALVIAM